MLEMLLLLQWTDLNPDSEYYYVVRALDANSTAKIQMKFQ